MVHVALGSNVGDRAATIRAAWALLGAWAPTRRLSRLYETRPLYVPDQPLYLNAVGEVEPVLDPHVLLGVLHEVETALGRDRRREQRRGPRTLDLDIVLWGALVLDTADLVVPHPGISERAFVLEPLLELAPGAVDPRTGQPFARVLDALAGPAGRGGVYLWEGR